MSIYLDHNATTPCLPEAQKRWAQANKQFGNPSGLYAAARDAKILVEEARDALAKQLGKQGDFVCFLGSATEANNQVLKSIAFKRLMAGETCHLIVSAVEHSSIMETCVWLSKFGVQISYAPVLASGILDLSALPGLIQQDTALISVMLANSETGMIQPVQAVAEIAKAHGILCHTDAVQAFGKLPFSVHDLGVDFCSVSAHKVYGPKGVGGLYVKEPFAFEALLHGGGQEQSLRSSTENTAGIAAFATVCDWLGNEQAQLTQQLSSLKAYFWNALSTRFPDCRLNGDIAHSVCNTLNVQFPGQNAHALAINLDLQGIAVATGSACSTGSIEASKVLLAMGLSKEAAMSSLRFSLGKSTTQSDLDTVIGALAELLA